jgi:hypothetical protein
MPWFDICQFWCSVKGNYTKMGTANITVFKTFAEIPGRSESGRSYPYRAAPVIAFVQARNGELSTETPR